MKKINKPLLMILIVIAFLVAASIFVYFYRNKTGSKNPAGSGVDISGATVLDRTWAGYKHYFIEEGGRVVRRDQNDTVSEGQAYAMLRAVWQGDKEVFDRCYAWTENNLSRKNVKGDNLLAWHWKDGQVEDWMPASDADIDYAIALIFASNIWTGQSPQGLETYAAKARDVLRDILSKETRVLGERRYLLPWIIEGEKDRLPANPSYYSPAHFKVFYAFTEKAEWLELAETTYFVLDSLGESFAGEKGVGLIPDWCSVDKEGLFYPLEGKSYKFGWESVRVPIRIGLDRVWFDSKKAERVLNRFTTFVEKELAENGMVFCEYSYTGICDNKYENPLFYAAYYFALRSVESRYAPGVLEKTRDYLVKEGDNWVYDNNDAYFTNSLAWMAEGLKAGELKNIEKE